MTLHANANCLHRKGPERPESPDGPTGSMGAANTAGFEAPLHDTIFRIKLIDYIRQAWISYHLNQSEALRIISRKMFKKTNAMMIAIQTDRTCCTDCVITLFTLVFV